MVGRHHWVNGYEFEQTLGDGEGQGSLVCWSPWGHKESDMTEQLNNNNIWIGVIIFFQSYFYIQELSTYALWSKVSLSSILSWVSTSFYQHFNSLSLSFPYLHKGRREGQYLGDQMLAEITPRSAVPLFSENSNGPILDRHGGILLMNRQSTVDLPWAHTQQEPE